MEYDSYDYGLLGCEAVWSNSQIGGLVGLFFRMCLDCLFMENVNVNSEN